MINKANMSRIETEFGVKIANGEELLKFLCQRFGDPEIIHINRKIYKKDSERYFFRVDDGMVSLKEDLYPLGKIDGIRVAEELDIEIDIGQIEKMERAIQVLGYNLVHRVVKDRYLFFDEANSLQIALDRYPDGDYLEVEGNDESKIMGLVSVLPIVRRE